MDEPGKLLVVATPIGNRSDLSPRARQALHEADLIACEDTRVTRKLFAEGISVPPLLACHEHNESEQAAAIVQRIQKGATVALVSDSGTPAISDPGFRVVRACRKAELTVEPIPGPSAAVAALSAAGLPSDRFLFVGFLAPKTAARRRFLEEQRAFDGTLILYESTHRLRKMLDDIVAVLGPDRTICVAREITKLHETIHTGAAGAVRERVAAGSVKGEAVVLIAKEGFVL